MSTLSGGPNLVTNGLVLYLDAANTKSYPGSGTVWSDLSINRNNGTLTNGPTFSSANGGSIVFDGTNDYIQIPDTSSLSFTNAQVSINAWVNIISSVPTAVGNENIIINKANYANGWREWSFFWFRDGYFEFLMTPTPGSGAGWTRVGSGPGPYTSFNTWYYVSATSNGLGIANLYINGILKDTNTSYTTLTQNEQAPLTIGGTLNGTSLTQLSNMRIPIIQLYNRALTAQEVLQNYNATRARFGL